MNHQAQRMENVQSPIIPVVGELILAHPGTISLGQGVVHYGPPPEAMASIEPMLAKSENHKYRAVDGIRSLRTALASKLEVENGILLGPDRAVVVTAGGNMAFVNALLSITDPGDEIIILVPYYFNHEMAITMANCKPILVPTDENYQPDVGLIEQAITQRTRAVITVSPNNPTGAIYSERLLCQINEMCQNHGIYHISDEAYEYFTYDGVKHFSPGAIDGSGNHTISLYSFSKAYGFASWRIGYMVIPKHLLLSVKKVQDTVLICPPVISQAAAAGALRAGVAYCQPWLEEMGEVRKLVLEELEAISSFCTVPKTDGAFYFLLRLQTEMDAMQVVQRLVREHRVAAIPGDTFGMSNGCYLRVAYGSLEKKTVAEGIGRLVKGLRVLIDG